MPAEPVASEVVNTLSVLALRVPAESVLGWPVAATDTATDKLPAIAEKPIPLKAKVMSVTATEIVPALSVTVWPVKALSVLALSAPADPVVSEVVNALSTVTPIEVMASVLAPPVKTLSVVSVSVPATPEKDMPESASVMSGDVPLVGRLESGALDKGEKPNTLNYQQLKIATAGPPFPIAPPELPVRPPPIPPPPLPYPPSPPLLFTKPPPVAVPWVDAPPVPPYE